MTSSRPIVTSATVNRPTSRVRSTPSNTSRVMPGDVGSIRSQTISSPSSTPAITTSADCSPRIGRLAAGHHHPVTVCAGRQTVARQDDGTGAARGERLQQFGAHGAVGGQAHHRARHHRRQERPGQQRLARGLDDDRELLEPAALAAELLGDVDAVQGLLHQRGPVLRRRPQRQLLERGAGARRRGVAGCESEDRFGEGLVVVGQGDRHAPRLPRPPRRVASAATTSSVTTTSSASGTGRNPSASIRRSCMYQPVVEARRVQQHHRLVVQAVLLQLQDLGRLVERAETACHDDDRIGSGSATCAFRSPRSSGEHHLVGVGAGLVAGRARPRFRRAARRASRTPSATTFIRPVSDPPHTKVWPPSPSSSAKSRAGRGVARVEVGGREEDADVHATERYRAYGAGVWSICMTDSWATSAVPRLRLRLRSSSRPRRPRLARRPGGGPADGGAHGTPRSGNPVAVVPFAGRRPRRRAQHRRRLLRGTGRRGLADRTAGLRHAGGHASRTASARAGRSPDEPKPTHAPAASRLAEPRRVSPQRSGSPPPAAP